MTTPFHGWSPTQKTMPGAGQAKATPAQVRYLMYLGVALTTAAAYSKREASEAIEKLKSQREGRSP